MHKAAEILGNVKLVSYCNGWPRDDREDFMLAVTVKNCPSKQISSSVLCSLSRSVTLCPRGQLVASLLS